MDFFQVFVIVVGLLALCFMGLAINVIVSKKGRFPNIHIGSNKAMKDRGITCAQTYDKMEQRKAAQERRFRKLSPDGGERLGNC
ncbi:MAG: hypothetical protein PHI28_01210 [Mangrovibacterium sp.]|nr:hypothetical protein [Mangrovibacterium sp.]